MDETGFIGRGRCSAIHLLFFRENVVKHRLLLYSMKSERFSSSKLLPNVPLMWRIHWNEGGDFASAVKIFVLTDLTMNVSKDSWWGPSDRLNNWTSSNLLVQSFGDYYCYCWSGYPYTSYAIY